MPAEAVAPGNHQEQLDRLPDDLRDRVSREIPGDGILASAASDLASDGRYREGYLVLTPRRLDFYRRQNGSWQTESHSVDGMSDAVIVEGLGMSLLRLLNEDQSLGEYRFTLRHAKDVARLHRQLEHVIKHEGPPEELPAVDEESPDEKPIRCDACGRVIPAWTERCPACMSRRKILFRLMDYLRPYKLRALAGLLAAIALAAAQLAQPYLTRPLINRGLGADEGFEPSFRLVTILVSLMAGLVLASGLLRMLQVRMIFQLGISITRDLRASLYDHLHKLSLSFFTKRQTGSLVARVVQDTERVWHFIAFTSIEIVVSVLTIVGVCIMMFVMNWQLALLALLPIPLMMILMVVFHKRMHRIFRRMWHRRAMMTAVVADALPGVRVIKAFSQERREVERFEGRSNAVYDEECTFVSSWGTYGPVMMLCSQIGVLIIWMVGGWWVVGGTHGMDVGALVAFTALMGMFMRPIHQIAHMDERLNRAATSAQRIFEILDTEPAIYSRYGAQDSRQLAGKIELHGVSFSYDGIRKVLREVDLTVEPGQMIGLAGPSGGGKTTMTNLICRFYDPMSGHILIDGVDLRDYELTELRQRIGVVLQEPFLFHGTVAENIAYGNPGATLDQIIEASRAANAHDFVVGFPDGYDTLVGERGQSLSGGERQRISIARAILNDPAILILDEATSSVDTETEKLIQQALDRLVANRTTIAIAHRLSTLRKADRLVILDEGRIVEEGTHEQLATLEGGLYAKLLNMQNEMQSIMSIE